MGFRIKLILAFLMNVYGLNDFFLNKLNKKYQNKYIRIINYHNTPRCDRKSFAKQLTWYNNHFMNVTYDLFERFLVDGELPDHSKPGIMLTFDDGLAGNFVTARKLLKEHGFTGYFMCSSDLVGTDNYMTYDELKKLISEGHMIADHTATHHRMNADDPEEVLEYEICRSKKTLEENTGTSVEIFCWCGGEEKHYTKAAYDCIKRAGYKYGFMTNSKPVVKGDNSFHIQRINVDASWPLYLVKFQVSGIMDRKLEAKRRRVDAMMESR